MRRSPLDSGRRQETEQALPAGADSKPGTVRKGGRRKGEATASSQGACCRQRRGGQEPGRAGSTDMTHQGWTLQRLTCKRLKRADDSGETRGKGLQVTSSVAHGPPTIPSDPDCPLTRPNLSTHPFTTILRAPSLHQTLNTYAEAF